VKRLFYPQNGKQRYNTPSFKPSASSGAPGQGPAPARGHGRRQELGYPAGAAAQVDSLAARGQIQGGQGLAQDRPWQGQGVIQLLGVI